MVRLASPSGSAARVRMLPPQVSQVTLAQRIHAGLELRAVVVSTSAETDALAGRPEHGQ